MRTDRISMTSVNLDELGEILKHNVQSRREDEAKAAEVSENEHLKELILEELVLMRAEHINVCKLHA